MIRKINKTQVKKLKGKINVNEIIDSTIERITKNVYQIQQNARENKTRQIKMLQKIRQKIRESNIKQN